MITYLANDLFESPAQVLVNAINTVGAMGKGIALEFKRKYPDMFSEYQRLCKSGAFDIGQLWLYKSPDKWVLNFPTKRDWRDKSQLEYIEIGLKRFVEIYEMEGITSISFPRLGCGLGGLNWEHEVRPLMERYLGALPIEVIIHVPA
jgi:O-acetyl-ADP-ribose deacetylase (regulator of RNase III)